MKMINFVTKFKRSRWANVWTTVTFPNVFQNVEINLTTLLKTTLVLQDVKVKLWSEHYKILYLLHAHTKNYAFDQHIVCPASNFFFSDVNGSYGLINSFYFLPRLIITFWISIIDFLGSRVLDAFNCERETQICEFCSVVLTNKMWIFGWKWNLLNARYDHRSIIIGNEIYMIGGSRNLKN